MQFDPKWGIALNIAYTICGLIAAGTIVFVGIPPEIVTIIKTTALDLSIVLGVVNMALGLWSSQKPGPMVNVPPPTFTPTVVKIILVAFALSFLVAGGSAQAQTKKLVAPAVTGNLQKDLNTDAENLGLIPPSLQVQPTGNIAKDLKTLWEKIVSASNDDLSYASKLAAGANTPASSIRKQCWDAIVAVNNQANGRNLKDATTGAVTPKPDPHFFTDVETLAEVVDNLSPTGPLFTSCAGASQLAKTNVLTFINAAVTGAAGIAAMPVIPGL